MSDALLICCALLTLVNILVSVFVSMVAGTIVYSWWKRLQGTKDTLPELLQTAIDNLAAKVIEPYREMLDDKGRATAQPNSIPTDTIPLDEEFNAWMSKP